MRKLKKKLIIFSIAAAAVTAVILIAAVLGALSQIISSLKGNSSYYSGSIEDLPEIITIEMINGAIGSEKKYGVPASVILAQIILESGGKYPGNLSPVFHITFHYYLLRFWPTHSTHSGVQREPESQASLLLSLLLSIFS